MDRSPLTNERAKEFRKSRRNDQSLRHPSQEEFLNAIKQGLNASLSPRELKDRANVVKDWVQESELDPEIKEQLKNDYARVLVEWRVTRFTKYLYTRDFKDAIRAFFSSAQEHLKLYQRKILKEAVEDVSRQNTKFENFIQQHSTRLESFDGWEKFKECREQLKTSLSVEIDKLDTESLKNEYNQLDQRKKNVDNAFLLVELQVAIADKIKQHDRAQYLLNSHREFFTGSEGPSNGTEVCAQISVRLRQLNNAIESAKSEIKYKTSIADILRNSKERLDWSKGELDRFMLLIRLQATIVDRRIQHSGVQSLLNSYGEFFRGEEGPSDGEGVCERVHEGLQQLEKAIRFAEEKLKSGISTPDTLKSVVKQLEQSEKALDEARPLLDLKDAQERCAESETFRQTHFSGYLTGGHQQFDESLHQLKDQITAAKQRLADIEEEGWQGKQERTDSKRIAYEYLEFMLQREITRNDSTSTSTGVDTLQEVGESDEGLNMNWIISGVLAVGGSFKREDIGKLQRMGIKHVVDTRAEDCDDREALAQGNIGFLHLPTTDRHALSGQQLREGTRWVNDRLIKQEPVLIHCAHGMGRSVMLICAVRMTWGEEMSSALGQVQQRRPQMALTSEQIRQLFEFASQLKSSAVYRQLQAEHEELRRELKASETRGRMLPLSEFVEWDDPEGEGLFDLVQDNSYDKIIAKSPQGQERFLHESYDYWRIDKSIVEGVLGQESFLPEKLIASLKRNPYLERQYKGDVGVWEGYTLEEHTLMVMSQFEKYYAEQWTSTVLTRDQFRLLLALHDIGKPKAVRETKTTSTQHEYIYPLVLKVLKSLEIPQDAVDVITSIVKQDHIGKYIQDSRDSRIYEAEQVMMQIDNEAEQIGMQTEDYFHLLTVYYMCDAGSYTQDAGGEKSLDHLFEFQLDSSGAKMMRLAPETQQEFDGLKEQVQVTRVTTKDCKHFDESLQSLKHSIATVEQYLRNPERTYEGIRQQGKQLIESRQEWDNAFQLLNLRVTVREARKYRFWAEGCLRLNLDKLPEKDRDCISEHVQSLKHSMSVVEQHLVSLTPEEMHQQYERLTTSRQKLDYVAQSLDLKIVLKAAESQYTWAEKFRQADFAALMHSGRWGEYVSEYRKSLQQFKGSIDAIIKGQQNTLEEMQRQREQLTKSHQEFFHIIQRLRLRAEIKKAERQIARAAIISPVLRDASNCEEDLKHFDESLSRLNGQVIPAEQCRQNQQSTLEEIQQRYQQLMKSQWELYLITQQLSQLAFSDTSFAWVVSLRRPSSSEPNLILEPQIVVKDAQEQYVWAENFRRTCLIGLKGSIDWGKDGKHFDESLQRLERNIAATRWCLTNEGGSSEEVQQQHEQLTKSRWELYDAMRPVAETSALKLLQRYRDNHWTSQYISQIIGPQYLKAFEQLDRWFPQSQDLVMGKAAEQQDQITTEQLLKALEEANDLARMIALKEARIAFKEGKGTSEAVREAFRAFQIPNYMEVERKKLAMACWVQMAAQKIDDGIIEKLAIEVNSGQVPKIDKEMSGKIEFLIEIVKKEHDNALYTKISKIEKEKEVLGPQKIEFDIENIRIRLDRTDLEEQFLGKGKLSKEQLNEEKGVEIIKRYFEMYLYALDQKAQSMIKDADMFVSYPQGVVEKILADKDDEYPTRARVVLNNLGISTVQSQDITPESGRRSKSLFEVEYSHLNFFNSYDYKEMRVNTECGLFGFPRNMVPDMRIIYGYLSNDPYGSGGYGETVVPVIGKIKKELKEIALVAMADTVLQALEISLPVRPEFVDEVDRHCLSVYTIDNPLEMASFRELPLPPEVQLPGLWLSDMQGFIVPDGPEHDELRSKLEKENLLIVPDSQQKAQSSSE